MVFIPELKVQALSKREASQFRPSDGALLISDGLKYPFAFTTSDAKQVINFLNHHFNKPESFDRIIIHCQAGVSRSQALALFVAKHYYKDEALYNQLLNQEGKVHGGNHYVYNLLEETLANQKS